MSGVFVNQSFYLIFLRQDFLLNIGLAESTKVASQLAPGKYLPCPPQLWDYRYMMINPNFYVGTRVLGSGSNACSACALVSRATSLAIFCLLITTVNSP